jgi:hypothetical protein
MAKETADNGATETTFSTDNDVSQLQGFATKDGEIIPRSGESAAAPGKQAAASTAPVKAKTTATRDEPAGEGDDAAAQQRHKSAQARIDRAVGGQRAAERERDATRAELAAMQARMAALETRGNGNGGGNQQRQTGGAPQPADYQYGELDSAYIRDLAKYEVRQEFTELSKTQQQQTTTREQEAAAAEWQRRSGEFRERGVDKYDDFEDVVFDNATPISPVIADLLFESDHGPEIAYALASDLKEAKRVSGLSPARQAAWFGRREAEMSSESSDADGDTDGTSKATLKTTQAPPPPQTRTRGSGGQQQVSASTSDFAAFERLATKQ